MIQKLNIIPTIATDKNVNHRYPINSPEGIPLIRFQGVYDGGGYKPWTVSQDGGDGMVWGGYHGEDFLSVHREIINGKNYKLYKKNNKIYFRMEDKEGENYDYVEVDNLINCVYFSEEEKKYIVAGFLSDDSFFYGGGSSGGEIEKTKEIKIPKEYLEAYTFDGEQRRVKYKKIFIVKDYIFLVGIISQSGQQTTEVFLLSYFYREPENENNSLFQHIATNTLNGINFIKSFFSGKAEFVYNGDILLVEDDRPMVDDGESDVFVLNKNNSSNIYFKGYGLNFKPLSSFNGIKGRIMYPYVYEKEDKRGFIAEAVEVTAESIRRVFIKKNFSVYDYEDKGGTNEERKKARDKDTIFFEGEKITEYMGCKSEFEFFLKKSVNGIKKTRRYVREKGKTNFTEIPTFLQGCTELIGYCERSKLLYNTINGEIANACDCGLLIGYEDIDWTRTTNKVIFYKNGKILIRVEKKEETVEKIKNGVIKNNIGKDFYFFDFNKNKIEKYTTGYTGAIDILDYGNNQHPDGEITAFAVAPIGSFFASSVLPKKKKIYSKDFENYIRIKTPVNVTGDFLDVFLNENLRFYFSKKGETTNLEYNFTINDGIIYQEPEMNGKLFIENIYSPLVPISKYARFDYNSNVCKIGKTFYSMSTNPETNEKGFLNFFLQEGLKDFDAFFSIFENKYFLKKNTLTKVNIDKIGIVLSSEKMLSSFDLKFVGSSFDSAYFFSEYDKSVYVYRGYDELEKLFDVSKITQNIEKVVYLESKQAFILEGDYGEVFIFKDGLFSSFKPHGTGTNILHLKEVTESPRGLHFFYWDKDNKKTEPFIFGISEGDYGEKHPFILSTGRIFFESFFCLKEILFNFSKTKENEKIHIHYQWWLPDGSGFEELDFSGSEKNSVFRFVPQNQKIESFSISVFIPKQEEAEEETTTLDSIYIDVDLSSKVFVSKNQTR